MVDLYAVLVPRIRLPAVGSKVVIARTRARHVGSHLWRSDRKIVLRNLAESACRNLIARKRRPNAARSIWVRLCRRRIVNGYLRAGLCNPAGKIALIHLLQGHRHVAWIAARSRTKSLIIYEKEGLVLAVVELGCDDRPTERSAEIVLLQHRRGCRKEASRIQSIVAENS